MSESESKTLGVYLHVPFCRTRCRYCDFYRVGENAERQVRYLAALAREIDEGWPAQSGARVDTVYFGGGTPSLLAPREVAEILRRLRERYRVDAAAEITLEANPSDCADLERLRGYREAGVDRLSLGVQSFAERELRLLGRRHDAAGAAQAVELARRAGFEKLSLDLMLAVPGQTEGAFHATVEAAIDLAPDHVSTYLLEVHAGSEMDFLRRERAALFPGEEAQRRRYLHVAERLEVAGFEHYEVSNFARPGHRSQHNVKYWRCEPVVAYGPSAHALVDGQRLRHARDLEGWMANPTRLEIDPVDLPFERVFQGLRTSDGVPGRWIEDALGLSAQELTRRVNDLPGLVAQAGARVRLTREGWLVENAVVDRLLAGRPACDPAHQAKEAR